MEKVNKEPNASKCVCLQCYKPYCKQRSNPKEYCFEFVEAKKRGDTNYVRN